MKARAVGSVESGTPTPSCTEVLKFCKMGMKLSGRWINVCTRAETKARDQELGRRDQGSGPSKGEPTVATKAAARIFRGTAKPL